MTASLSTTCRNNMADELIALLGASAKIQFYTGSAPASVNSAATGTLLAECVCNSSAFASAASSGTITANNVAGESYVGIDSSANNAGTIGYCRISNSGGTAHFQENSVSVTGGGGAVQLPSLAVASGEEVKVTSVVLTMGNS